MGVGGVLYALEEIATSPQPAGRTQWVAGREGREIKERGDAGWSRFRRFCEATFISERKKVRGGVRDQAESLAEN